MGLKVPKDSNGRSEAPRDVLANLPTITEPRCNVCKSDFRPLIDRMIAGPYTFMAIARQFRGKDKHLNGSLEAVRKSIERHAKSHVTVRDAAIREIIEQRAAEAGMLVDDVKSTYLTAEALLELYMQKGFEQVTKDDTWVRHQDVLQAVQMLEQMRKDTVMDEIDAMKKQVYAISQAVKEIVPPELHPLIVERAHKIFTEADLVMPPRTVKSRDR
jgi:hypothetical protein